MISTEKARAYREGINQAKTDFDDVLNDRELDSSALNEANIEAWDAYFYATYMLTKHNPATVGALPAVALDLAEYATQRGASRELTRAILAVAFISATAVEVTDDYGH